MGKNRKKRKNRKRRKEKRDVELINPKDANFEILKEEQSGGLIKMWTKGVEVEDGAKDQLLNVASMPFIHKWVAAMPDVHWGMGATVGSVIPTLGAIIPAAVGVDIGCGMCAVMTDLTAADLPDTLLDIRVGIESAVPHGRTNNGGKYDKGAWDRDKIPVAQEAAWMGLEGRFKTITDKHRKILGGNTYNHLGTLGTGNHFIEVCLDEEDRVWIMLHSGSRGIGNKIGSYFIRLAKEDMRRYFINLPDENLSYLPEGTDHFDDYVEAVSWAQDFARINRELMMDQVIKSMKKSLDRKFNADLMAVNCHHNYISRERHFGENVYVTRKGAVCARKGKMGIIPGSMGAKSYIVRGLGNSQSFDSCSHGAGRRMSRREARESFTLKMHREATEGVECRKDKGVIDETPGAYKDIDAVMEAQKDLVEVVHTLKQIVCVKG